MKSLETELRQAHYNKLYLNTKFAHSINSNWNQITFYAKNKQE